VTCAPASGALRYCRKKEKRSWSCSYFEIILGGGGTKNEGRSKHGRCTSSSTKSVGERLRKELRREEDNKFAMVKGSLLKGSEDPQNTFEAQYGYGVGEKVQRREKGRRGTLNH